jgi:hypothetical protein
VPVPFFGGGTGHFLDFRHSVAVSRMQFGDTADYKSALRPRFTTRQERILFLVEPAGLLLKVETVSTFNFLPILEHKN